MCASVCLYYVLKASLTILTVLNYKLNQPRAPRASGLHKMTSRKGRPFCHKKIFLIAPIKPTMFQKPTRSALGLMGAIRLLDELLG